MCNICVYVFLEHCEGIERRGRILGFNTCGRTRHMRMGMDGEKRMRVENTSFSLFRIAQTSSKDILYSLRISHREPTTRKVTVHGALSLSLSLCWLPLFIKLKEGKEKTTSWLYPKYLSIMKGRRICTVSSSKSDDFRSSLLAVNETL